MPPFKELGSILRIHIVAIAVAAALVFGWLFAPPYLSLTRVRSRI